MGVEEDKKDEDVGNENKEDDDDEHECLDTVIITSPGRGQGSEMALVLTRALVDVGLMRLKGVVANLAPCLERARLVRGSLDVLGFRDVPAGVGFDESPITFASASASISASGSSTEG